MNITISIMTLTLAFIGFFTFLILIGMFRRQNKTSSHYMLLKWPQCKCGCFPILAQTDDDGVEFLMRCENCHARAESDGPVATILKFHNMTKKESR